VMRRERWGPVAIGLRCGSGVGCCGSRGDRDLGGSDRGLPESTRDHDDRRLCGISSGGRQHVHAAPDRRAGCCSERNATEFGGQAVSLTAPYAGSRPNNAWSVNVVKLGPADASATITLVDNRRVLDSFRDITHRAEEVVNAVNQAESPFVTAALCFGRAAGRSFRCGCCRYNARELFRGRRLAGEAQPRGGSTRINRGIRDRRRRRRIFCNIQRGSWIFKELGGRLK
jgi:hypothetical protein